MKKHLHYLTSVGLMVIMVLLVLQGCAATSTNQPEEPQPEDNSNITPKDTLTVAKELIVGDWNLDLMITKEYENLQQVSYTEQSPFDDKVQMIWSMDTDGGLYITVYSLVSGEKQSAPKNSYELLWREDKSDKIPNLELQLSSGGSYAIEQLDDEKFVIRGARYTDTNHVQEVTYSFTSL